MRPQGGEVTSAAATASVTASLATPSSSSSGDATRSGARAAVLRKNFLGRSSTLSFPSVTGGKPLGASSALASQHQGSLGPSLLESLSRSNAAIPVTPVRPPKASFSTPDGMSPASGLLYAASRAEEAVKGMLVTASVQQNVTQLVDKSRQAAAHIQKLQQENLQNVNKALEEVSKLQDERIMWQKTHDECRREAQRDHARQIQEKATHIDELKATIARLQQQLQTEQAASDERYMDLHAQLTAQQHQNETLRAEASDTEILRERCFNSILLCIKLGAMTTGTAHLLRQVDMSELYDQAIKENVPVNKWHTWISGQLFDNHS